MIVKVLIYIFVLFTNYLKIILHIKWTDTCTSTATYQNILTVVSVSRWADVRPLSS